MMQRSHKISEYTQVQVSCMFIMEMARKWIWAKVNVEVLFWQNGRRKSNQLL